MQKLLKYVSALDWILSGATIAYGLWTQTMWLVAAGVVGLVLAWYSPAKRIQNKIANSALASRRRSKEAEAAKAAIEAVAAEEADTGHSALSEPPPQRQEPTNYGARMTGYSAMRLHPSKHNRLRTDSFNLHTNNNTAGFN